MKTAKVRFKVEWKPTWPPPPDESPKPGELYTIVPGTEFPDEHPIVLTHPGYFDDAS